MTMDLRFGDCLDILPTLADKSVDAIITDVPYGTTACKWDVIIPLEPMWEQVKRLCKGAFVTTASQPFTSVLVASNINYFRHEWAWDKTKTTGGINASKAPLKSHESVLVFSKNGQTYNPQMTEWTPEQIKQKRKHDSKRKPDGVFSYQDYISPGRESQVSKGRYPDTMIRIRALGAIDPERTGHPTQKPVALYEYLIKTYTNEGDTVLDFCMGSGTTGVSCVKTGRNFIGIEKQADYYEIAQRRINEAQQQMVMAL